VKRHGRQIQLGDSLQALVGRLDRKTGGGALSAVAGSAWQAVAGPTVLKHTTGAFLRDKTLVVYVDSPIWATELAAMADHYKQAVNTEAGQELVSEVRFSVSRKVVEQHRIVQNQSEVEQFYGEDNVPSVQLTTAERAQVVDSVKAIPDEELRETVLRATVKDLEWKKGIRAHRSREEPRETP